MRPYRLLDDHSRHDGPVPEPIVGELYLVQNTLCLMVEYEAPTAALHILTPFEGTIVTMELGNAYPFQGRLPAEWLNARLVAMSN
jgi:hypothetical protein